MKKMMILILLLCGTFAVASDPVVVLSEKVSIQVDPDGRVTRHVDQVVQLNSFRSVRSLGEWFYSFNPELERVEILKSVTIQTDGTEVPIPDNARLVQTPYAVQHAPDFSGIREMMVSHTGLEPGCKVHFEYRTTDLKPHRLVLVEWMAGRYPIVQKSVTIQNESGCPITMNGTVAASGNTYTVSDQKPVLSDGMFDKPDHRAFIAIELKNPVQTLQDRITSAWKDQDLTAALQTLSLNPDSASPVVRESIRDLLSTRLDTIHLDGQLVGYQIRSIDRILRSGYATDFEKVVLASALFTRYGIDHTVILADHTVNGHPLMDDAQYLVVSGSAVYPENFEPGNLVCMPLIGSRPAPPEADRVIIAGELKEKEDGLKGELSVDIETAGTGPAIRSLVPVEDMTFADTTIDLKDGHHMMARVSASMPKPEKTVSLLDLPNRIFHAGTLTHDSLWCNVLTIPRDCELVVDLTLVLNGGMDIVLPAPNSIANKWGSSTVTWTLNGNRLRIHCRFNLKGGTATAADMAQIRELAAVLANPTSRTAVFN